MTEELLVQISVPNCPASLKEKLEELAAAERRSLAAYVRIVLEKHLRELEQAPAPVAA